MEDHLSDCDTQCVQQFVDKNVTFVFKNIASTFAKSCQSKVFCAILATFVQNGDFLKSNDFYLELY
jgi:hypothetical protein